MEKRGDPWDFVKWSIPVLLAWNGLRLNQLQHSEAQADRFRKHYTVVQKGDYVEVIYDRIEPTGLRLTNTTLVPSKEWPFLLGMVEYQEEQAKLKGAK